jgi:hypothetical protein
MLQSKEVEYMYKMYKCNESVDRVDDEMIKKFYSYNNEEIGNFLPGGVVITLDDDGIPEIVRLNEETFNAIEEVEE